ncbi:hypothetical protein IMG5_122160 [Ichthyophthirius multifiliis]|uniref:Uncharacterized protein n=1 Tax=Ichthyophthirius multifiliis TaxID=5932 RepID=G0QV92_ICHMU|nr:hypothetical protein IMG5_122160 [Ichthyophthirius multifiliis]EGR30859.1 hypothetical protein IMG5_122160 [Ichthyophthirius multifiliis]|eukprot:XP_004032446.1 hypothetical protein IMG5_122160 [Ichthyophthirius multifiliis]
MEVKNEKIDFFQNYEQLFQLRKTNLKKYKGILKNCIKEQNTQFLQSVNFFIKENTNIYIFKFYICFFKNIYSQQLIQLNFQLKHDYKMNLQQFKNGQKTLSFLRIQIKRKQTNNQNYIINA